MINFSNISENKELLSQLSVINNSSLDNINNKSNYIYLIKTREFIRTNENIYKIGRTSQDGMKRINQYPKGSELIIFRKCIDCIKIETELLKLFKIKYKHHSNYGNEYFEGNELDIIKDINNYIDNELNIDEIKKINLTNNNRMNLSEHSEDKELFSGTLVEENTFPIFSSNCISENSVYLSECTEKKENDILHPQLFIVDRKYNKINKESIILH
jgi:hypothetical protein